MRSKKGLLGLLLLVYASNAVDRFAFGLVLQDIKTDLDLSDTQLGVLTGIAFALFYAVMAVPIARWADRGNRVKIVACATALWSAMVALCGLAGSFLQLLLIRVGVAVGEAGLIPPANALIADQFTRAERPRAVATFMLGAPVGCVIGYLATGWLNELYGWRITFIVLGLPGLVLGALVWFTLRDPTRETSPILGHRATAESVQTQPGFKEVCVTLWKQRTFRHLLLGFSVMAFFTNGVAQWQPAFFIRSFGLGTGELGAWFAGTYGLGGLIGTYWGGALATRYAADNERLQLRAIGIIYVIFGVVSAGIYLAQDYRVAFGLIGLAFVVSATTSGPLFAALQTLVSPHMRAVAIALVLLFANLIGMGLGPLTVGALSDVYRSWAGDEALRYALLTLCPGYFWGGWHLWWASRTIADDLAVVETQQNFVVDGVS